MHRARTLPLADLHPIDCCVAEKLRAASLYCTAAVRVSAQRLPAPEHAPGHQHGRGHAVRDRQLENV